MKFLSGNIFQSNIFPDFNFNNNESMQLYVNIKTSNFDLKNIKLIKRKKKMIIYQAYFPFFKKHYQILVFNNAFGNVKFRIKGKWHKNSRWSVSAIHSE